MLLEYDFSLQNPCTPVALIVEIFIQRDFQKVPFFPNERVVLGMTQVKEKFPKMWA